MIQVTDETFQEQVLQSALPVLVDFWAEWCGPCKMITPAVEYVADRYQGQLAVAKMDVDANPNTPAQLGIMGIPTLILFKQGEEVERVVGYRPQEALAAVLAPHLG
ncbi:MAG: thioredoxin [Anaerolineae bacterium]|nr:thioredoxin [Anaerolineae bacterium]